MRFDTRSFLLQILLKFMRRLVTQLGLDLEGGGFLSSSLRGVGSFLSFSGEGEGGELGMFFGGVQGRFFGGGLVFVEVIGQGVASAVVIFLMVASSVSGSKEFLVGMGQFRRGEPELGRSQ